MRYSDSILVDVRRPGDPVSLNSVNVAGEISSESGSGSAGEAAATLPFTILSAMRFNIRSETSTYFTGIIRTQNAMHSISFRDEPAPE